MSTNAKAYLCLALIWLLVALAASGHFSAASSKGSLGWTWDDGKTQFGW